MTEQQVYFEAQLSVLRDELLDDVKKLEIIRVLQRDENLAKFKDRNKE